MGQPLSSLFPGKPTYTEADVPDQTGRVFIITGASGGVGKEVASILYQRHAKIYMAARSADKTAAAITAIQTEHPQSNGALVFLPLDLADLTTIASSAQQFLSRETRLDVLFLNAGVMSPPAGSKTVQGYELQLGTNNIGHFLFTKLLHPVLTKTAAEAPANTVRVVWVSSSAVDVAPKVAIDFTNMDYKRDEKHWIKYGRSKAGNVIHAAEFARRTAGEGIVSVSLNPGNLATDLSRSMPGWHNYIWGKYVAYPAKYGAYTELFAALHPDLTADKTDQFIAPWGKFIKCRKDLYDPALGRRYWEWTEEQVKPYL